MTKRHIFRKSTRSADEAARLRADRDRYQRLRPTPEQLLAEGGHTDFVPLGDLLELHQVLTGLKTERERRNLTLAQVSKRAGIDPGALSRLETGRNSNPTYDTVRRVAAALGKSISWTFRDIREEAGPPEPVDERVADQQDNEITGKTVWRLIVWHEQSRAERRAAVDWALTNRRIAIGWGEIGDIRQFCGDILHDLKKAIQDRYRPKHPNNARYGGESLYDFCYRMKRGDLVILSTGKSGGPVSVMEITGPYEYVLDHAEPGYPNGEAAYRYQRKARTVNISPRGLWEKVGGKPRDGRNIHQALVRLSCIDHADLAKLKEK
jgi:transcriptional regulator with XRE-family HTH domain